MNPSSPPRDPVERLAEEFVERLRRGERPSLTEYVGRHPELAAEIRDLFPALAMVEQFGSVAGPGPGPPPAAAGAADVPPPMLGDYRIVREVGRGGMGVVYEAVQESLGRHVALKVLPAGARGAGPFRERFRREARAAARLHHTNVVPVFGVGEAAGTLFYAMQFIRGQGLDVVLAEVRRLRNHPTVAPSGPVDGRPSPSVAHGLLTGQFERGPPDQTAAAGPAPAVAGAVTDPPAAGHSDLATQPGARYFREVARLGAQAADALHYAHGQGVLHRDVKPSNLLLDAQGTLWVADFGLAKADDSENLTDTGDIVGTLRYMAPERFRGLADARSDTYALGVTLYEMLTLRPAVDETDRLKLIDRVVGDRPPAPRAMDARIPHDLETVVLKAMARDPADRYRLASEFADDLRRFLADQPVRARRHSIAEQAWRWCRRNPALSALAAAVAALGLFVAIGSAVAAVFLRSERDAAVGNLGRAVEAETHLRQSERDRTLQLFNAYVAQARAGRFGGRPGRRVDGLQTLAAAAELARELSLPPQRRLELRNEAIACMARLDVRIGAPPVEPPAGFTYWLNVDAACEHVVASDSRGSICVYCVADGREVGRLGGFGQGGRCSYFSPDGRYLCVFDLVAGVDELTVWDWRTGRQVMPRLPVAIKGPWVSWSADGRLMVLTRKDSGLAVIDVAAGKEVRSFSRAAMNAGCAFHPRDHRLAVCDGNAVTLFDADTGQAVATMNHPGTTNTVSWRPDGRGLAVASGTEVFIWDLDAPSEPRVVLRGFKAAGIHMAFSHSGDLLASTGWDKTIRIWDRHRGQQLIAVGSIPHDSFGFSPDDRRLVMVDQQRIRCLDFVSPVECRTVPIHEGRQIGIHCMDFSPDGRRLATAAPDGACLWDTETARPIQRLDIGWVAQARFEPGGGGIVTAASDGVKRWPLRPGAGGAAVLGPPELLHPRGGSIDRNNAIARDRAGRRWAVVERERRRAVVWDVENPDRKVPLPHDNVQHVALSPDGRLAVTGTAFGRGTRVWDAATGALVKDFSADGEGLDAEAAFSPDGRRLAISSVPYLRLWRTDTWQPERTVTRPPGCVGQGPVTFSPDGQLIAYSNSSHDVRLLDAATGEEVATLPVADEPFVLFLNFSPDGRLLAVGTDAAIYLWELRAVRDRLKSMGMDWELAPTSPRR